MPAPNGRPRSAPGCRRCRRSGRPSSSAWARSSRRARTSGQRLLVSGVDPAPSVIESPKATMAPAASGAATSTRDSRNQLRVVPTVGQLRRAGVIAGFGDVAGLERASCASSAAPARWSCPAGTGRSARSANGGTVSVDRIAVDNGVRRNGDRRSAAERQRAARRRLDRVLLVAQRDVRAPIVSGAVPNALLSTTRSLDPPMLVWTI